MPCPGPQSINGANYRTANGLALIRPLWPALPVWSVMLHRGNMAQVAVWKKGRWDRWDPIFRSPLGIESGRPVQNASQESPCPTNPGPPSTAISPTSSFPRTTCSIRCWPRSAAAGLPEIQVSPAQGKLLHVLARSHGVGSILEIGTLGGYSTIWLARALPPNGRLVTLEFEAKHAAVARANIARAGLADRVEIRIGPALESLPQLAAEGRGPFDLIFIDADKEGYPEYLDWALAALPPRQPDHRRQCGAARGRDRSDRCAAGHGRHTAFQRKTGRRSAGDRHGAAGRRQQGPRWPGVGTGG